MPIERSSQVNRIRAHPVVTTIIAGDIFSRSIAHSCARFRPTPRWNPKRSPAIELDRQGRSCRREVERIRRSARFTRRPVRDRPTLAGPEDSPRPHPRPRSRRKERKKPYKKGRQDRETNGEKEREKERDQERAKPKER